MCRLCHPDPREFAPSYASVALTGHQLQAMVEQAEAELTPCFTAWCEKKQQIAWIATDRALFPTASAHHAHKLALLARLQADFGASTLY
jgi:hypothetical protein